MGSGLLNDSGAFWNGLDWNACDRMGRISIFKTCKTIDWTHEGLFGNVNIVSCQKDKDTKWTAC
jgi:hypothetical protein